MTGRNERSDYEASLRLQWTGSAMIVVGVAVFVMGLLAFPSHLVVFGAIGGAAAGLGVAVFRAGARRRNNAAIPRG